ncbi:MAG: M15 family metallopeptidase [Lachnospiraceae bacterium]|nr:M15 family metallopeptidase [Lachnospiraceae bacterium]
MKRYILIIIAVALLCTACNKNDMLKPKRTVYQTEQMSIEPTTQAPTQIITQAPTQETELKDTEFVRVEKYIPTIVTDLKYATADNFTNQRIYDFDSAWLRYGTVKKLQLVANELETQGYCIKIWDAFRPTAAQFKLWSIYPDATYVANPNVGFSSHSRGNTVDITLVYKDGTLVLMPTGFDDFTQLADRDYSDCTDEAMENALLLENTMKKYGFKPYFGEWWHFSDVDTYEVEKTFIPTE